MEWISVKERLPDYKEEVLFVSSKNEVSVGRRLYYQEGTNDWSSPNSIYLNDSIEQKLATCKYWMALPKAPKGE